MLKKVMLASLCSIVLFVGTTSNVFAATDEDTILVGTDQEVQETYNDENGTHYIMKPLTDEEIKAEVEQYILDKYDIVSLDNVKIVPYIVTQDKIDSQVKKVDLGKVGGQDSPTTFQNGGSIYWEDGGATVSVSFSLAGTGYSIGVSVGYKTPKLTGYAMYCRPGEPTLMALEKTVEVVRWHVYGWDEVSGTNIDQYVNTQNIRGRYFYNCY